MVEQKPAQALAAFETLDPDTLPPSFLYAPFRLQQTLRADVPGAYLVALRQAVSAGRVSPLIQGRVQARDGDLSGALASYLRTDPGTWAGYDLESLQRIATHQGLRAELRNLIAAALASARVAPRLESALRHIVRGESAMLEPDTFKSELRRAIEEQTPAGKLAVESAKKLLNDRKQFLRKDYAALLDAHRRATPMDLSTETVLFLFLSSVELKRRMEMDRWGQELKRRHSEREVREWVSEMTESIQ